jgi:hypothetical protein
MALSFDVISTESLLTLGFVAVMFVATTPNAREYDIIPRDMNDSDKHDVTEFRSRTHTSDKAELELFQTGKLHATITAEIVGRPTSERK